MESSSPSIKGRPVGDEYFEISLVGSLFSFAAFSISNSYLLRKLRAVLSLKVGKSPLNFLTAAIGPFSEAYFPMLNLSFAVHFVYEELRFLSMEATLCSMAAASTIPIAPIGSTVETPDKFFVL